MDAHTPISRMIGVVTLILLMGAVPASTDPTASAATMAAPPIMFPDPATGLATITRPTGADFVYTCNSQVSDQLYHVAGSTVLP